MAESIADRIAAEHQLVQHGGLYEDVPDACGCGWSQRTYGHTFHVAAVTEAAVRAQNAGRIHSVELHIQHMLEEDPINPRLHGALSALQQARDIAEGKKLV